MLEKIFVNTIFLNRRIKMEKNEKESAPPQQSQGTDETCKVFMKDIRRKPENDKAANKEIQKTKPQELSLRQAPQDIVDIMRNHDRDQGSNKRLERIAKWFKSFRTIITTLIILVFILSAIFFISHELSKNVILIEHFEVPEELEKQGYTSRVIINKLIDKINLIGTTIAERDWKKDGTYGIDEVKEVIAAWSEQQIELEIPGGGISLNSIIQYIRKSFIKKRTHTVFGEATTEKKNNLIYMTIRVNGNHAKNIDSNELEDLEKITLEDLEKMLQKAAENIYRSVEPFILALYLYNEFKNKSDNKKDMDDIVEIINHIISHEPTDDDSWAYNLWGVILKEQKEYDEAIEKHKKAIELDPSFALAYNNLGYVLLKQGHYKRAIDNFKKAVELDPKFAYPYNNWGVALRNLGNYEDALARYEEAIKIEPGYSFPYNNWGYLLLMRGKKGDYKSAIDKFKNAIDLSQGKHAAPPYHNWGNALLKQGDIDGAIDKFQKAAKHIHKEHASINCNLWGNALLKKGDFNGAIEKYNKAIELDEKFAALAYNNLGNAFWEQKKYKSAIYWYKKATESNKKFALAYINWGFLLLELKDYEGAIDRLQRAINILFPFGKGVRDLKKFFLFLHS